MPFSFDDKMIAKNEWNGQSIFEIDEIVHFRKQPERNMKYTLPLNRKGSIYFFLKIGAITITNTAN